MSQSIQQALVVILSGDSQKILEQFQTATGITAVKVVQVDEKVISRFREMLRMIRIKPRPKALCFGCKDLELQRYQFVLKSYLFLVRSPKKFLLDEQGKTTRHSLLGYLVGDVPRFLAELVASIVVVSAAYLRLTVLRSFVEGRYDGKSSSTR